MHAGGSELHLVLVDPVESPHIQRSREGSHESKSNSFGFTKGGGKKKLKKIWTILKLVRYAGRREKWMLAVSLLAAVINGMINPLNVSVTLAPAVGLFVEDERHFYDNESQSKIKDIDLPAELAWYGYQFYIFALTSIIVGFLQISLAEVSSQNIIAKIKADYLAKLLSVNIAWYDKSEDQFVNTVTHDLQKMKGVFDSQMTSAVEIISFFIFGNIAGFYGSGKVALVTFTILMASLATVYILMQLSKREGREQREYNSMVTKLTGEVLGNARTLAAYGGEAEELNRFELPFSRTQKFGLRQAGVLSLARAFNYFIYCICYAVAFYFAAWLYTKGDFTPAGLVYVLIAQLNVIYHSTGLLSTISDLFMAVDSAHRVMSVIEVESNFKSSMEGGIAPDNFLGQIIFKNVTFSYPSSPQIKVLKGLNLEIRPGQVTAVVGTSGAGKSTVVGLVTRLYDTVSGQVLVDGLEVRELNVSWLRSQIGVVMQEPVLFDATIEENIRFGRPEASREEVEEAARVANAHDFIKKLPAGYKSVVGERGVKLSGGQKQRIAIARALVRRPKLLLLDEATSALDTRSEGAVQAALDSAMKGRTTVVIAHRMSTVRKANLIYALKDGVVMEKGSHEELMERKGYYHSLVKTEELEQKDKAPSNPTIEEEIFEEEIIEENEGTEKSPENQRGIRFRVTSIKLLLMWLLTLTFCCITSAFLPAFYYVFTLLCQTFSHKNVDVMDSALLDVILLVVVGFIAFVAVVGSGMSATKASQMWLGKIRKKAFRKVISMDISWFDKNGNTPNETLETLINSPALIESVTGDRAAQVVIFFLSLVFTIIYSFCVSTTIALINVPIIVIFIIINAWRVRSTTSEAKSSNHTAKSTKIATEYVQNVKTIQLLNCQSYVLPQYERLLNFAKKEALRGMLFYAFVFGLSKALIRISTGSSLIFGGNMIANGEVRGTQLLGIVIALSTASMLAGPILVLMSQYPAARQALSRLYRIVHTNSTLDVFSDQGLRPFIRGNIVFKNVSFAYPTRQKVQILNNLNLNIEAGKTVALVGNSGCGKSTIISLLERFYLPTGGKIIVDGIEINEINLSYLRRTMGLVSQEPVLFDLTVRENILYGLNERVADDAIIAAARIANIHETILKLPQGYDTMVGDRGSKLSGGQKQRIAIARAVLRDPKILLLDEATSALDTESEKIVQEALEKASMGRTTIIIAHRLSTIRKADKIVVLQKGVVVEEGTHEELLANQGHYWTLLQQS